MSWEDQGRQQHGWFGSGTSPNGPTEDSSDASGSVAQDLGQRLDAIIYGAVAAMPSGLRGQAAARLDAVTRGRLNALMTTWSRGGSMDRGEFAGQFFGQAADDPVAMGLRTAALTARLSGSQDALRDAAEHLAGALQTIGMDRLPQFLHDAETRANEPSTLAALDKSRQTLAQRDAIRPVYPVETAIGIAAAAIMGGPAVAARAAIGAVARQLLPKRPTVAPAKPLESPPAPNAESTLDIVAPGGRPVSVVAGRARPSIRTVTQLEFQSIKDRLLQGATQVARPRYGGIWYKRQDASEFGLRNSLGSGPTIDVEHPDLPPTFRIHQK
jgi:hypothetical protein